MTMSGPAFDDDPFKVSQVSSSSKSALRDKMRKKSAGGGSSHDGRSGSSRSSSSWDGGGGGEHRRSSREQHPERRSSRDRQDKARRIKEEGGDASPVDAFGFDDSAFSANNAFGPSAFSGCSFDAPPATPAAAVAPGPRPRRTRRASVSCGSLQSQSDHGTRHQEPEVADYGYGYETQAHAEAAEAAVPEQPAPRARRGRRSSVYGDSGPASRHVSGARSCDGLELMGRGTVTGRGARSVDSVSSGDSTMSNGSGDEAPRPRPRRGRRASVSGGGASSLGQSSLHADYRYGAAEPSGFGGGGDEQVDYGYGDLQPDSAPKEEKPQRERRQRSGASNLLDDLKGGDYSAPSKNSRNVGAGAAATNSMIVPMVVPMAEKEKRPRRRASLIGAINIGGRKETNEEVEAAPKYDPSQDRDRRNANSLMDRVGGAGAGAGGVGSRDSEPRSSYSDRILQGR